MTIGIICSKEDLASQNIKKHLISSLNWYEDEWIGGSAWRREDFIIFEVDSPLIYQDYVDRKIIESGYNIDGIVFASRHRSADGRKIFTVHFTGNLRTADYGGKPFSLAEPFPQLLKPIFLALKRKSARTEFQVVMEATHHGPSEIKIPSIFVEIGSSESEWMIPEAGKIISEAILETRNGDYPVAVGIGGTHYMPRQTELLEVSGITFGHCFAKYAVDDLNEGILSLAIEKSDAEFIFLDKKSLKSTQKKFIMGMADDMGIRVLDSRDIKQKFP